MESLPCEIVFCLLSLLRCSDVFSLSRTSSKLRKITQKYTPWTKIRNQVIELLRHEYLSPAKIGMLCRFAYEQEDFILLKHIIDGDSPMEISPRKNIIYKNISSFGDVMWLRQIAILAGPPDLFILHNMIHRMLQNGHVQLAEKMIYLRDDEPFYPLHKHCKLHIYHIEDWIQGACLCKDKQKRLHSLSMIYNAIQGDVCKIWKFEQLVKRFESSFAENIACLYGSTRNSIFRTHDWDVVTVYQKAQDVPLEKEDILLAAAKAGWTQLFLQYDEGPSRKDPLFLEYAIEANAQDLIDYLLLRTPAPLSNPQKEENPSINTLLFLGKISIDQAIHHETFDMKKCFTWMHLEWDLFGKYLPHCTQEDFTFAYNHFLRKIKFFTYDDQKHDISKFAYQINHPFHKRVGLDGYFIECYEHDYRRYIHLFCILKRIAETLGIEDYIEQLINQ